MMIMIAAAAENNALGKDNQLLWHLPDDFKHFRELTTGHYIIMGRKTFEGFPKLLPNRTHVVITRQENYAPEGCIVVDSLEKAIAAVPQNEDSFIIGGGEIYRQAIHLAEKIELTRVHETFEADTFFPQINGLEWHLENAQTHPKDERHKYDFTLETYIRK